MGSIRIQPPIVSSQTHTLPPPLTSTSSPRPIGGGRQMLVKALPLKTPAGSHIKINTTITSTVQTNTITMPQPRIPPSPNIINQPPPMINKVQTPISVATPVVASSKPPSKEKEKKTFSSSAAYV